MIEILGLAVVDFNCNGHWVRIRAESKKLALKTWSMIYSDVHY